MTRAASKSPVICPLCLSAHPTLNHVPLSSGSIWLSADSISSLLAAARSPHLARRYCSLALSSDFSCFTCIEYPGGRTNSLASILTRGIQLGRYQIPEGCRPQTTPCLPLASQSPHSISFPVTDL